MENAPFLVFCLFSINNISFKGYNDFFKDYIDLKNTFSVKGIFVWMIIFFHYELYYKRKKRFLYEQILDAVDQKVVTIFFFYSGYGIYESIKKKGNKYFKTLLKKSLNIFIKSEIMILIFLLRIFIYKKELTFKKFILTTIFKSNIGNSNWYALTIILFYIYAFLAFGFIKNKKYNFIGIIIITILCTFHAYFLYYYYYYQKMYSVDNTLTFILGFLYSLIRKYTDKYIMKYDFVYFGIFGIFSFIYYYFYINKGVNILLHNCMNGTFGIIVILITMKIRFDNEFLRFLNIHSYSIYFLQKVVLRTFYEEKYLKKYENLRIMIQFVLIIFMATIFDYSTSFIDKYFKRVDHRLEVKENIEFIEESKTNININ